MNFNVDDYIQKIKADTDLWKEISLLLQYVIDQSVTDFQDVGSKYTDPEALPEQTIKEIINEKGFDYITSVMDTIDGFTFNKMLSFVDLITQLKGSRPGLELVLKLLGFDSLIREWWEDPDALGEPLTYEMIVFVNSSFVPDLFVTLDKVQIFSDNYVLGKLSNVDVRFLFDKFAELACVWRAVI